MEDIKEYSENLQRSLMELERALAEYKEGYGGNNGVSADDTELKGKVRELTEHNETLERELLSLRRTYDCLRAAYDELLGRLNAAIELVKSILERE